MATFAGRLRKLRADAGLSEAKLADKSGIAFGTIHDYGLGRRKPAYATVVRIAIALGVDCNAFADCEEVKAAVRKPAKGKG